MLDKNKIEKIKKLAEESLLENSRVEINEGGVPCFFAIGGEDAYHEGEAPGNREAVMAIVKHHTEDKYLLLRWNKIAWYTFITGGIEDGQTAEEAARAEVLEETGYKNLKLIKKLRDVNSKFYHVPKQENRTGHFHNFYFELENDEQEEIEEKEKKQHGILWTKKEDVEDLLTASGMRFIWKTLK